MALNFKRILFPLVTLLFIIIAFIFSLVAGTSKEWAVRNNYNPAKSVKQWTTPIYTLYRSPFTVCGAVEVHPKKEDPQTATRYDVFCTTFNPYGFNSTSCELASATQRNGAVNVGDARLCQQIHLAGHTVIASGTCLGVAMLLCLLLTPYSLLSSSSSSSSSSKKETSSGQVEASKGEEKGIAQLAPQGLAVYVPVANLIMIGALLAGILSMLISQFYGVIGFIQSAPNNADFASTDGGTAVTQFGSHGPWYQGKALSTYATVAWVFALAGLVMALVTWRLPMRWTAMR